MIRNSLLIALISVGLAGCASFHQNQIQGQRLTTEQVQSIHKGLTRDQVIGRLGSPVLQTVYDPSHLIYVFVMRSRLDAPYEERLIIHLVNNRVTDIQTNRV